MQGVYIKSIHNLTNVKLQNYNITKDIPYLDQICSEKGSHNANNVVAALFFLSFGVLKMDNEILIEGNICKSISGQEDENLQRPA